MRITLITRRFPPMIGGAEKVLSYLAPAFVACGAEVTVLTSRLDDSPPEETREGAKILRLATSPLRFIGTFLYMRNLRRWLETHPIDVAYVSMMKHDAYVAVKVGQRLNFPVVLRPEGAGDTGDIAWQNWGRGGKSIARRAKQANAFVAISAAVHNELLAACYDATKIIDLPNGVPIPAEPWTERPNWQSQPRACFVGRLAPEKNLATLIEAWPLVLNSFPTAKLTLIGDGPERAALEAQTTALNLSNHITFTGKSPDPTTILRESDLFILPSREEGMSIALLEAMALGMPLVASEIPGNQKLITHGTHGHLAPPNSPPALADAIVNQWTHFTNAITQGQAARGRVIDHYSIAAVARAHLDLFARLRNAPIRG